MSLLDEIKCIDLAVGKLLEGYSDHEMASLTPEELHRQYGGPEHVLLRLAIMKLVHSKRAAEAHKTGKEYESKKAVDGETSRLSLLKRKVKKTLAYKMIVSGKTFRADVQMVEKLEKKCTNIKLVEDSRDHKVTILFCPISSRLGADVVAAMNEVKDENPIILVLMNHSHEPQCVATKKRWDDYPNIAMFVHVFFHETESGLIKCQQNDEAIDQIAVFCTQMVEGGSQPKPPSEKQLD